MKKREKESKEIPALSLSLELGFLQGEEHIKLCVYTVCARASLFIYRALALAAFIEEGSRSTQYSLLQTPI